MQKILHGDCKILLNTIDDNSIDCVITDPPYFLDKLDNNWKYELHNDVPNSHVSHLPKGMKFKKTQSKDLYNYYLEICKILYVKMKPGSFLLTFSSPRLFHSIAMACDDAGFEIRDSCNWVYTQSIPKGMSISHVINRMNNYEEKENLLKKYKNHKTPMLKSCFEPICVAIKPIECSYLYNEMKYNTGLIDFSIKVGLNKIPSNVITTDNIDDTYDQNFLISKPSKKEKGEFNNHFTVKPLNLIEHLVKLFSKENSLILDPFTGSGTTAIACKNTNRQFIGMEINEEYYRIAVKRLNNFN